MNDLFNVLSTSFTLKSGKKRTGVNLSGLKSSCLLRKSSKRLIGG